MKMKWISTIMLVLAALLLNTSFGAGQEPAPGTKGVELLTNTPGAVGIQGRLTDENGVPLNGNYGITFSLYETVDATLPLCYDANTVPVTNGLFSTYLDNCYNQLSGQKVWLGIQVGSDPEMTPRQVIYPVPYALSLRPGTKISADNTDGVLTLEGTTDTTEDYDTLAVYSGGSGEAVQAYATSTGVALYGESTEGFSVQGYSDSDINTTNPAVFGCKAATVGGCPALLASPVNPAGVAGVSTIGDGVQGLVDHSTMRGVFGGNDSGVGIAAYSGAAANANHWYPSLYLIQSDASGDFAVGAASWLGTRYFRIDRTGKGFFDGGTQASGADFAEQIEAEGAESGYEPGDVLVISTSQDRAAALASEPYSTRVLGIYSSKPGYLAGAPDTDDPLSGLPVAVVGIVPCKVSAENGPIQRGDLLVTSATPGYAMRAGDNPPVGAVLGKAMEALEAGAGLIEVLVTLQ